MDTRSLIEESTKPKAHVYWGDGAYRKISGRHWLYSTVRPKEIPGYATVAIGPEGTHGPKLLVCTLNGKPYQDGSSMGVKPMIYTEDKRAEAVYTMEYIQNRGWNPVPGLKMEEWYALEEIKEEDDSARIVDWPLAGFVVALDTHVIDRHRRRPKKKAEYEKHVKKYGNEFGAEDEGWEAWGRVGFGGVPDVLRNVDTRPDVPELERLLKQFVETATSARYAGNSYNFVRWWLDEYGRTNLSSKAFNRGYRVDDLGYEGQDNYALVDKLVNHFEKEFTSPAKDYFGRQISKSVGTLITKPWREFQRKLKNKRTAKGKKTRHSFSYE